MEESGELPRACASAAFFIQDSIHFIFNKVFRRSREYPRTELYEHRPSPLLYRFTVKIGRALLTVLRTRRQFNEVRLDTSLMLQSLEMNVRRLNLYRHFFSMGKLDGEPTPDEDPSWGSRCLSFLVIVVDLVIHFYKCKDTAVLKDIVAAAEAYLDVAMRHNHELKISLLEKAAKDIADTYISE